jgi:hypothetical protein
MSAIEGNPDIQRAGIYQRCPPNIRRRGLCRPPPTIECLVRKSRRVGRKIERAALLGYDAARLESLRAAKVIA